MARQVAQVLNSTNPTKAMPELKRIVGEHGHAINEMLVAQEVGSNIFFLRDGITAPTAITGVAQIYIDIADGDLKIMFGSGVTKTIETNP